MQNDKYYLWGAGTFGRRIIEFMKDDVTFEAVIDNDPVKQGTIFYGLSVVSFEEVQSNLPGIKVVIAMTDPADIRNFLLNKGFEENKDFYLIYGFVPRFYHELGKTVPMVMCFVSTTMCNMKCSGCQTYIPFATKFENRSASDIIGDVDLMFSHIDSIMTLNFCCGENFVNKNFPEVCTHIHNNYRGRYHVIGVQTNGTIVPDDESLRRFSDAGVEFSISDYPENAKTKEKLIEKCHEFNISYYFNRLSNRDNWYDFGDPRIISESDPEKLKERYRKCWLPGLGIYEGWAYSCVVQSWSHAVAGAGTIEPGDVFDLNRPKNDETVEDFYRIISRQPKYGYVSHCMRCNGAIPVLKQNNQEAR